MKCPEVRKQIILKKNIKSEPKLKNKCRAQTLPWSSSWEKLRLIEMSEHAKMSTYIAVNLKRIAAIMTAKISYLYDIFVRFRINSVFWK